VWRGLLDHPEHHRLWLADREAADRVAMKADIDEPRALAWRSSGTSPPARCRTACSRQAPSRRRASSAPPSAATAASPLDIGALRRQTHAFVELHGDVGAEQPLHLDRALGRQFHLEPVDMRAERHRVLVDLRSSASDITWKPPESVSIGPFTR